MRAKFCDPKQIIAGEPNDELRAKVQAETGISVTADNLEVARSAETILIGVKPGVVLAVVREMASVTQGRLVISLAAGVRVENMERVSHARLMRAMTNTPTAILRGATAIARGARTTPDDMDRARNIFDAIGVTVEVNEDQIDAVTGLSGSGPAFVYSVIEALGHGGTKTGLPP
ncbi:MAG: NAD(P)-binding domain-containing protein, partial [Verrucomicrobiota bacterium]|nr:NAD(P)-binding domain-containing protein [Verrucomicrobiota bacterium]